MCDVCGSHLCKEHARGFTGCEHVVCAEHVARCSGGGEEICPLCHETCAICGQHTCAQHSAYCRRCGQKYCQACVGKSGLCETCATITEVGKPVDMSLEPCAEHPSVAELASQFAWVRAANQRYVIYSGRSRLLSGAIVVLERRPGEMKVVAAHRLSLPDMLRDRFVWPGD